MTYEEIVAGLRTLRPSDFDDNNVESRGRELLYELTNALRASPVVRPKLLFQNCLVSWNACPTQIWVRRGRLCIRWKL